MDLTSLILKKRNFTIFAHLRMYNTYMYMYVTYSIMSLKITAKMSTMYTYFVKINISQRKNPFSQVKKVELSRPNCLLVLRKM